LNSGLRSGEKIIQPGPFGDLIKVERISQRGSIHVAGRASDRVLLKQGDLLLEQGKLEEAKDCYARCLDYVSYLPEAKFGLAVCALHEGDADRAYKLLVNLIKVTMIDYGAAAPDPVEWAYFLLALVCKGQLVQARRLQDFYPSLSHNELRRARLVLDRDRREDNRPALELSATGRKSIHRLPRRSDHEWLACFADILDRCQQPDLANVFRHGPFEESETGDRTASRHLGPDIGWRQRLYSGVDQLIIVLRLNHLRPNVPPLPEFRYFWHLARGLVPRSQRIPLRRIRTALSRHPS
jgi:tetratricopeptide (TPR) repeat protein